MNKLTRITSAATAGILAVSALTGCSPYRNPGKYITVPEKGSITLKQSEIDKAYDEEINDILEENYRDTQYTELTDEKDTVQKGDKVSIRYYGRPADDSLEISEETIASMSNVDADDDTELVIGSGAFIGAYESDEEGKSTEGFEDQLIGWKNGQVGDITVTFPDDYKNSDELQGVVVVFHVTIKKIERAYVEDDTTIKVSYEFEEEEEEAEETEDSEKTEESKETAGDNETAEDSSKPSAAASGDATEAADTDDESSSDTPETAEPGDEPATSETTEAPETDKEEDEDDEDEENDRPKLSDVFKNSSFTIDYTEDIEDDDDFNDLFFIKDYADLFKGQSMEYEYSFEYTVTEEDAEIDEAYKEYIGRTFTVKLTIIDITSLPEWTDELVSDYTNETYTTVSEFEEILRKNIRASQALEAILDSSTVIEWPKSEQKKLYKQYVDALVSQQLGGTDPSSMTQKELDAILTEDVYAAIYAKAAENALIELKQKLVYEYLFKELEIKISGKEYKELRAEEFNTNAMYYYYYSNYTVLDEEAMESYVGKDNLMFQFKYSKLFDVIGDYVVVDEAN